MAKATETAEDGPAQKRWPTAAKPIGEATTEARRRRILDTTIELVAIRGYKGTSAERICRDAAVSYPSFRRLFDDKEDCVLAAISESVEQASSVAARAYSAQADPAVGIAAALGALLEVLAAEPARTRVCLVESLGGGEGGIAAYEAAIQHAALALREARSLAPSDAVLPPLLEETICSGAAWTIHQLAAKGETSRVPELYEELARAILAPYIGEGGAAAALKAALQTSKAS